MKRSQCNCHLKAEGPQPALVKKHIDPSLRTINQQPNNICLTNHPNPMKVMLDKKKELL